MSDRSLVVALSGGIGGAKLALGLDAVLAPGNLAVIVNTGDDFEHLGLSVSPDLDTVLYTLAGVADSEKGWGRSQETWNFMAETEKLGGETWFRIGDKDLAVHIERTVRLKRGETLSSISASLARSFGVAARILPATDDVLRTMVETDIGTLDFQDYFVRRRCAPAVRGIVYRGARQARPGAAVQELLQRPDLRAVIVCPSNPYLSVDPMLAIPGVSAALRTVEAPVVAVSPLIGGQSVKGPTAKIMHELNLDVSSATIAAHYGDLLDGLVLDSSDGLEAKKLSLPTHPTPTLMKSHADKSNLAREVLLFADALRARAAT